MNNRHGRIILQPPVDGAFNMAADEVLLADAGKQHRVILRLYQWNPWTLSLGKHQSVNGINMERCRQKKYMVVRRLTGGRAVLHARELTYSICVPTPNDGVGVHHDVALKVGQALCHGVQSLGADVQWVPRGRRISGRRSSLCFASVARGEILWRGKKIVGSAQRILDNVILQHGSILLDHGHEQIVDLWEETVEASSDTLKSHTATLREILGEIPDHKVIVKEILEGFRLYFEGLDCEEELTNDEKVTIAERAKAYFLGGWEMGTMGVYARAGECAA